MLYLVALFNDTSQSGNLETTTLPNPTATPTPVPPTATFTPSPTLTPTPMPTAFDYNAEGMKFYNDSNKFLSRADLFNNP